MAEDEGQDAVLVELKHSLELLAEHRRAVEVRLGRVASVAGAISGAALGLGAVSVGIAPLLAIVGAILPAALWGVAVGRMAKRRDSSLLAEAELLDRKHAALLHAAATPPSASIVRDLRRLLAEAVEPRAAGS